MSGGRTAMTQSHSVHGGALSFMSCTSGRESSPLDENDSHQTGEFKTETKKKRFHPLRNLRRMFRRKNRHSNVSNDSYNIGSPESTEISTTPLEQRSCSTSKLAEENGIQNLMKSNRLAPGLSLSHDSVFNPDRADSGLSSSDLENSSLSISNFVPPPVEFPLKSHSSCSESSLLSMDSSEAELSPTAVMSDLDLGITSYKLSHSAAKHKMAVKPKRNHGAPRSKWRGESRPPLPSTPEVNEDTLVVRSFSPNTTDTIAEIPEDCHSPKATSPVENERKRFEPDFTVTPKIRRTLSSAEKKAEESHGEECGDLNEEDWGDKDEDIASRKEESFFGRLLSRRSEKKKKKNNAPVCDEEHSGEDSAKSPSKDPLKSSASGRSVNRRQRVEPIEIPSSPSLLKKTESESSGRNSCNRMKISYSMSPPKTSLPSAVVSRSSSPPKVVWPEHFSYYKKEKSSTIGDGRNSVSDETKIRRDLSPSVSKTKETQKIIADEVESKFKLMNAMGEDRLSKAFDAKDDSSKSIIHDKDESFKFKAKGKQSKEEEIVKSRSEIDRSHSIFKLEGQKFKTGKIAGKSNSNDSVDKLDGIVGDGPSSLKPVTDAFPTDVLITHEEPHYVNLKNILPVLSNYEKVHHGYENVQVIELVKKEKDGKKSGFEEKGKSKEGEESGESPIERKSQRFERPKSLRLEKTDGTPEFMKVQLNKVEPRVEEKAAENGESPKSRSTLIERRKSELMMTTSTTTTTDAEEKDWKQKGKVLKKQTSFSESQSQKRQQQQHQQQQSDESVPAVVVVEKIDSPTESIEVVMRKKSNSTGKQGEDQPELMKVFARRSLKVRESEEIVEEMRRSRDSDKENENGESPKEERKKKSESDEKKVEKAGGDRDRDRDREMEGKREEGGGGGVVIQVTSLKPEIAGRKNVLQKYVRVGTEKTRKDQSVLEESKSNKKECVVSMSSCVKEANSVSEEESEETGFKRIQQRKAEWERRVQQAAK